MDLTMLLMLAVLGVAFYFMIIRPQKQRQRQQQQMIDSLAPGAKVMTTAGVFGTLVERGDDEVRVEVAPGVVLTLVPGAIAKVVTPAAVDDVVVEETVVEETVVEPADSSTEPKSEA